MSSALPPATIESTVQAEPLLLVEFIHPRSIHCKLLAPQYEEAATALKEKNIKLAKVDCVEEAELCRSEGIRGYPTLKVYQNGKATNYNGPRKADSIISYMVQQHHLTVSEVTAENHDAFTKSDKIVVLAYLATSTDASAAEFNATAISLSGDYLFGMTTDKAAIESAGVTPPAIIAYRSFDEPKSKYPHPISSLTESDLEEWVKEFSIPIFKEVIGANYHIYVGSRKLLALLFIDPTLADKEAHIAALTPVAAKYKPKINFAWIDALKFGDHAKFELNLAEAKWPAFVIHDVRQQLKYPFGQAKDVTPEGVADWVEQYLGGKLQPQIRSQPIPETQSEPVFTLVGKNFEETVFDDSKDVFVEFYAQWCTRCERFNPTWDSLGQKYAAIKDRILIAKMEIQENELPPSIPIRNYTHPVLKFKPAGSRDFIDYNRELSFESLVAFVKLHAKNPLELPIAEEFAQTPLDGVNAHFIIPNAPI